MRIAYCPSVNIPTRAAEGVDTVKRCHWFSEIGHDVTLLAPNIPDPEAGKNPFEFYSIPETFAIIRLPWLGLPGKRLLCGYLAARKARERRVDLVYARSVYACFFALLLGLDAALEMHTPIEDAGKVPEMFFRRLIRFGRFKRLVVITGALKSHYRNRYGMREECIMVAPEAAENVEVTEPVNFNSDRFKVGYVGNLFPGKGMEIISELSERCPWAEFHCVGGTDGDIRRWESELHGQDNVVFHGFVRHAETDRYRAACDALIAPYLRAVSDYGGGASNLANWMSPLKVFEYMAAAKPILCSDLPVLREVLEDERTALLCDPDRIEDWVRALERLRKDEGLRSRLGDSAREEFLKNYTWKARAKEVLKDLG